MPPKNSKIRVASAPKELVEILSRGMSVDVQIKNLSIEDKLIKEQIAEGVRNIRQGNEVSLRVVGDTESALVSFTRKASLDTTNPAFETVEDAVNRGLLDGVIKKTITATVNPSAIEKVRALLGADFDTMVSVNTAYSADPETVSRFVSDKSSPEKATIGDALQKTISVDETVRVKYEFIQKETE